MYEASDNQLRYILAERFTSSSFPIPVSYRFSGKIDRARLEKAIAAVMEKHEVLRSRFFFKDDLYKVEYLSGPFHHQTDAHHLPAYDEAEVRRRMVEYFYAPVEDFSPKQLIRSQIIYCGRDEVVVTLSLHHCISDGVSTAIFINDVFTAYNGLPVEEGSSYAKLSAEFTTDAEADHAFWSEYLEGVEPAVIAHDLKAEIPISEQSPYRVELPYDALLEVASSIGARPFPVIAALTSVLLKHITGTSDTCFTYQSAGRRLLDRNVKAIGPFSNTIVMRLNYNKNKKFKDFVYEADKNLSDTIGHEFYSYSNIINNIGCRPNFGINYYPSSSILNVYGLNLVESIFLYRQTDFDIDLRFVRVRDQLELYVFYDRGKYSQSIIENIVETFTRLLKILEADPYASLNDLLLPPVPVAVASVPDEQQACLFDEFLNVAEQSPERLALSDRAEELTYGDVAARSAAIASQLLAAGLGLGKKIAIYAERNARHVCNLLGVLRAGAIAVPFDSDYPDERLATLASVALPDALLSSHDLQQPSWAADIGRHLIADRDFPVTELPNPDPTAMAYILFTSGSTGRPKGVATSHLPIINFLKWQRHEFRIAQEDRFTNLNGLAHDMIMRDIFAPLSIGASLHIPEQEQIFIPGGLARWCAKVCPTFMHLTPAMAEMLMAGMEPGSLNSVRTMIFGGDRLQPELTSRIYAAIPDIEIINFYGATETPQAATWYRCIPGIPYRTQPIGRGITHFTAQVVDADHRPVRDGVVGEISITSPYLSLGYVENGKLVPHTNPDTYYTGDQGFVLPDGNIMFVGRQDDQVSIRGIRVELGEITAALKDEAGVEDAAVLLEQPDNPRLVAFVVGEGLTKQGLRSALGRRLPRYMVPADIVLLDALPLLPNGKLDRQKMLVLPRHDDLEVADIDDASEVERSLISAWARVLGHSNIGHNQSFADLGGDSLNHVQAYLVTEAELGRVPEAWDTMTIRELVAQRRQEPAGFFQRMWTTIESTMLTRAVAITLIVALHLRVFSYGGGGTTALMLVSGVLMARTQIEQSFLQNSTGPLQKLLVRVIVPCYLYVWVYTAGKMWIGDAVHISVPTLTANLVDYPTLYATGEFKVLGTQIHLWYISALIQIFILLFIFMWMSLRLNIINSPLYFILFVFLFGCVGRFIVPGLVDSSFWQSGFIKHSIVGYLPTTHISTLALGMLIGLCRSDRRNWPWLVAVLVGYAGLTAYFSSAPSEPLMLLGFGGLMLFVPRLPIPRGLSVIVLGISGASLFLYLSHRTVGAMIVRLGVPDASFALWGATILVGVLSWVGWQYVKPAGGKRSLWARLFMSIGRKESIKV